MVRYKKESYGAGEVARVSPPTEPGGAVPNVINIGLTLEEALKLNLAIDECAREINSMHRGTREGKNALVCLSVKLGQHRIDVLDWSKKG
jgi:hypothetical protein